VSFVQILFLLGTLAVVGPIAAHLLARPRFRRVPFTMLRFLRTGEIETQSRRRLRNLFILLLRCAIVVLIALFFAGPQRILAQRDGKANPVVIVGLDDSLSMAYDDVFPRAVEAAGDMIREASAAARFHVIGLASGESVRHVDAAHATEFVSQLRPVPLKMKSAPLLSAVDSATRAGSGLVSVRLVSDFTAEARAAFDGVTDPVPVHSFSFTAVSPDGPVANLAILDARILPGSERTLALAVTVANYGSSRVETTVTGVLNDGTPVTSPIQADGNSRATVQLGIPFDSTASAYSRVELSLDTHDNLPQDDRYYVGLGQSGQRAKHVLVLAKDTAEAFLVKTALETLAQMNPLDPMTVQVVTHARFSPNVIRDAHVIVLTSASGRRVQDVEELAAFVRAGGRLIAFTNADLTPSLYEALSKAGVLPATPVELQREPLRLAANVHSSIASDPVSPEGDAMRALRNYRLEDLPISAAYTLVLSEGTEVLWSFGTGDPFLCYKAVGSGTALLVNTSADDALSPLMKSSGAVAFASYLVGGAARLEPYAFEAGETVFLPESEFELAHGQIGQTMYALTPGGATVSASLTSHAISISPVPELGWVATQTKPVRYAGVNVPRGETDVTVPSAATLELQLSRVFKESPDSANGSAPAERERKSLWRGVAWSVLGLLLLDVFVSNRVAR
jgi:hypothetical protein